MGFEQNDDLLKHLIALGVADASGKILGGALIDGTSTASGTVQNTEYTLNSVTLPAGALNKNGRGAIIAALLTTAGNANNKNIKVYLGATAIATITASTANAKDVIIVVFLLRTGASTQIAAALCFVDGAIVAASSILATAAIDDTAAITVALKSANTAAAAASATGKGLLVAQLG
jgi:hypothetical protein